MNLEELRLNCAIKQKRGLHFILASIVIWCAVLIIQLTSLPILTTIPEKMLMVIAMIFGAHLLPYGWLYKSKSYMVFSIVVPILSLMVGLNFEPYILAALMIVIEILFSACLIIGNKKLNQ
ncbi:MAG: hypothetical protein GX237_06000 [Clostridiales bacterium]|nr:hypothetical protein [Clostridiales bacterium]